MTAKPVSRFHIDDSACLFGKPESFSKRRMGVAVAGGADVDEARTRARQAAGKVRPVAP